ncbi:retinoic acid-induced protein 1 [Ambystoma mexicanum]|uniref:retinoic acid-induced protein 1 n=1 Tax=Ambystoma mexicanum TaxID=8296 RepID=UPI0037E983AC
MQSFRERCGFHSNQQNYQPPSQDSSRLENYRHQSQPGLNCERQRLLAKEYYNPQSFQGYENSAVEKYHRGNKQVPAQQLQTRPTFPTYGGVQENNAYSSQYSGEEGLQNWASPQHALTGEVTKYGEALMKKTTVPTDGRQYQEQSAQLPFQPHPLHLPQQQQNAVTFPKLQRQKIQDDASSFPQTAHFSQHSQSFPPTSTYSSVQGHTFKSCSAPSSQHQERPLASANMATSQRVQSLHSYQPSRISYDQQQALQSRHHGQETLHYQNLSKYQHYNQQSQTYCQSDSQVRTPEQYYQTFSPSSSHSPARSVGRSPSYSSTPSPLMPNLENFQYNQQPLNSGPYPAAITDRSHFMPLLNPSPTDTSSPEHQSGNCKKLQKDKLTENILTDLSLQSLNALTSQVENISNTVQQLLLSKSGIPQKKNIKNPPRTPEQLKGQHCSPENNTYSMDQIGTPVSDALGTPQSVHNEVQDTDYLSGSDDPLERGYLFCDPSRSPATANHNKMKPESLSTCSVTSPDNMSVKSDDSFQSINATLPLDSFAKYVSSDGECPRLLVNALSQDELSSEIIALQDAINSEKTDKDWDMKLLTCNVRSPGAGMGERFKIESCMKNSIKEIAGSKPSNDPAKSPFQLENSRTCHDPTAKSTWTSPEGHSTINENFKSKKVSAKNSCTDFSKEIFESTQAEFSTGNKIKIRSLASTLAYSSNSSLTTVTSSYSCYSNSMTNSLSAKNAEAFGWLDKSINESCLRWKELEISLNSSDSQKDVFQGKLMESIKEQKSTCHEKEPASQNALSDKLHNKAEMGGEEEAMSYLGANKTDNERWLEDARNCCADSEFQDISLIGSPDVKESDLEQGEYSPLCGMSNPDRKSLMDDGTSSRSIEKPLMVSLDEISETPEDLTTAAKEFSVSTPPLTSQSVMLLGPVIGTETKVNSWFGSSLPHIEDEEEGSVNERTGMGADQSEAKETTTDDLNSQIVPQGIMKMNLEDRSESKSPQRTKIHSLALEGVESRETFSDRTVKIPKFVTVTDQNMTCDSQTECESQHMHNKSSTKMCDPTTNIQLSRHIVSETADVQAPMENFNQQMRIEAPTKSADEAMHIQVTTESVGNTADVKAEMEMIAQTTHIHTLMKSVPKPIEIRTQKEKGTHSGMHLQAPEKSVAKSVDIHTRTEGMTQTLPTQGEIMCSDQLLHMQAAKESGDKMEHIRDPTINIDQTPHMEAPLKNVLQIDNLLAPVEGEHTSRDTQSSIKILHPAIDLEIPQATDSHVPMESMNQTSHIQPQLKIVVQTDKLEASIEIVDQTTDMLAPLKKVGQFNKQVPLECVHQTQDQQAPTYSVHQSCNLQAPSKRVGEMDSQQSSMESMFQTDSCCSAPFGNVHQTDNLLAPIRRVDQGDCHRVPMESLQQTENLHTPMESHQVDNLEAPMESVNQAESLQVAQESAKQTTNILAPLEYVNQDKDQQALLKSGAQTVHKQIPTELVDHIIDIETPLGSADKIVSMLTSTERVDQKALIQSQIGNADQCVQTHATLSAAGTPVRMCTRSFTAMGELQTGGPHQLKLAKKVARDLKRRAVFKTGLQDCAFVPEGAHISGCDLSTATVPSPVQDNGSSNQKLIDADDQLIMPARNQRSMILRSRTKAQDLFHIKRRREKRATEARLKKCKGAKRMEVNRRLASPAFKLACRGALKVAQASKGQTMPKPSVGGKAAEQAINSLKRKSNMISPIPTKKRNLILRRNAKDQKQGTSRRLFKKRPLIQKGNKVSANGPCHAVLKSASSKGPRSRLKIPTRSTLQGGLKTKVLPPRKGRGLKLEAIVQKIASPHLKKHPCITPSADSSIHEDPGSLSPPDSKAWRNRSACSAAGDSGRPVSGQASSHRSPAAEQLCKSAARSLKRNPDRSKSLYSESSEGEACSSPETGSTMGIRSMAAQSPVKRNRRGRPPADLGLTPHGQALATCLSPAATQSSRDKMDRIKEREPSSDDQDLDKDDATEGKLSPGRLRKRANHATFNGYSKRHRKALSPGKSKKSKAKSRKRKVIRNQAPIICPTEPEIRLKYLSCKPLQRGEGRAKPFAPYVQVERKDAFSTICTVVNSLAEESALQVECSSLATTSSAQSSSRPTLPCSSAMQLGPLVSKAIPITTLLCCLCRNPSNHRDLGDLCGPYYPEDCLPKKKSRLKERMVKVEGLDELPLLPPDRTLRTAESGCRAAGANVKQHELDGVAADSAKQTLRSSTRGLFRKLQSCYCCDVRADGEEAEKSRRHQCNKASPSSPLQESGTETQEHWVHEACTIWTRGVYLVGGKLYGLQEASDMAAKVVCPSCQQAGASVSCCHKGCAQTYHFTCANDTGCLLNEDNFSLRCLKHKRHFL